MAIVRGSRTIKLKEKIKHIRIATNGSQFQGSLPASITLKALAFNFTPVSYNWYKGESTTSIGSNSVLVVPNNTVAKVETFKVIVKEKDGTAYEEVISITKVVDGQGSQGLNGKMIIQREWKKGDVYRNTDELIDYIYHRATNTWWKLKAGYSNVTADTNPGGQFEKVTAMEELALTNVIAEGGNIAGFIFKDGKMISQKPNLTSPNLVLDGTTGKLIAKDAEISGKITINPGSPALDQVDKISKDNAKDAVNNIEVGGRNYLLDTSNNKKTSYTSSSDFRSVLMSNNGFLSISLDVEYDSDVKPDGRIGAEMMVTYLNSKGKELHLYIGVWYYADSVSPLSLKKRITETYNLNNRDVVKLINVRPFNVYTSQLKGVKYSNCEFPKIEKGNKKTDWSPAPEDTDQNIMDAVDNVQIGGRNYVLDSTVSSIALGTGYKLWTCSQVMPANSEYVLSLEDIIFSTGSWTDDYLVHLLPEVGDEVLQTVHLRKNLIEKFTATKAFKKIRIYIGSDWSSGSKNAATLHKLMLTKGNKKLDWVVAPEDIISEIKDNEVYVEYSVNGTSAWHFPATSADRFMRQKKGDAAWSVAMPFGKDGKDGLPGKDGKDGAQGPKGSDGINGAPGKPGVDGKTPYVHTAYANSADGRVGFSLSDSKDKAFWGNYTDFTKANSTDPTKYTWIKVRGEGITSKTSPTNPYEGMLWIDTSKTPSEQKVYTDGKWVVVGLGIDDIQVGGRNYVLNSDNILPSATRLRGELSTPISDMVIESNYNITFLFSCDIKRNNKKGREVYSTYLFEDQYQTSTGSGSLIVDENNDNKWFRVYGTIVVSKTPTTPRPDLVWNYITIVDNNKALSVKNLKLEVGTVYTDWTPAPEDVQAEIDKANAEAAIAKQKAEEAKREAANLKVTTDKLEAKTNYLSTTIDGNVVTTGTVQVGDANNNAKAGITGVKGTKANERVVFYAGSSFAARETAPAQIWDNGLLVAKNANIEGTVKANSGYFGGFKIESNKISSQDNQFEINSNNGTITYKDPRGKVLWSISKDGIYFSDRSPETYTKISYRKLNADKNADVLALIAALGSYGYIEVREAVQIKNIKEVQEGGSLKYINTGNVTVGLVKKTSSVHGRGGRGGVLEPGSDLPYGFEYGDFVYYPFGYKYNAGVNEASFQNEKNNGKIFTEQTTSSDELKLADGWWVNEVLHKGVIDYITKDSKIDYTDSRNTPLRNFPVNIEFKYYENGKVVKTLTGIQKYNLLEGYSTSAVIADTPSTWWKFY